MQAGIDPEKKAQIRKMLETSPDFRQLHEEHHDLHGRIAELIKRRHLAPEEERQLAELKKRKLALKDAMGRILFEEEFRNRSH